MTYSDKRFWDDPEVVRTFAELPVPPYWEDFFSRVARPSEYRVLDIGCGGGRVTTAAVKRGFDVWACDRSNSMVAETRRRLIKHMDQDTLNERIIQSSAIKLPFADSQFDCVIANGLYHNVDSEEELKAMIHETGRVLRPGGWLCLNVFINGTIANDLREDKTVPHRYFSKENLSMVLLPKKLLIQLFRSDEFKVHGKLHCYESKVLTGERTVLRGIFRKQGKTHGSIFNSHVKIQRTIIGGVTYFRISGAKLSKRNPFIRKGYDFDIGFYQGEFEFNDPITRKTIIDTVETYGRKRMVARVLETCKSTESAILDIGSGMLNVAREITRARFPHTFSRIVNCDVSGPWSSPASSTLVLGVKKFASLELHPLTFITNVEQDLNSTTWIFGRNKFDCITACMVIHHIEPRQKLRILKKLYQSLKKGGRLIVMDVFTKSPDGVWLTSAGKRGPAECGGDPMYFLDFLAVAKKAGFRLDPLSAKLLKDSVATLSEIQFKSSQANLGFPLPINKATWCLELTK